MKHIVILGSTGSIGCNTLQVIRDFPDKFKVTALSTNSNIEVLSGQIREFCPRFICVKDEQAAYKLKKSVNLKNIRLFVEEDGLNELVKQKEIDMVVVAVSGSSALMPLFYAIDSKKEIALANKEALVAAGHILMEKAARKKVKIIPIDSEQSAIWQCLQGEDKDKLKRIYLTASGGPLRKSSIKELKSISRSKVLRHPRWKMGKKITVDSATLMNKGFEVIEAMHLFALRPKMIKVLIHPQAIIHSMAEFIDGSVMAQLSVTDMRIPIQYALSYPQRLKCSLEPLDFCGLKNLSFYEPDFKKFPCLSLAYRVASQAGESGAVLNAANEACVEEFLKRRLRFILIPSVIEGVLGR
ncbi:MAG: 1-deoxy-D-xylulose-5-phosphate reductoisomerase, partial [Candidatus Omnitrophica bacterium]|nr:1-deoxy-D-xylulose-5-phosphate reductoisomerase [Candidatus Omnitrophota bacterium]